MIDNKPNTKIGTIILPNLQQCKEQMLGEETFHP